MSKFLKLDENGNAVPALNAYSQYNKATVVSEDNMAGIEAHIEDMNLQGFRLVNVIHMGIKLMMFWELIPR